MISKQNFLFFRTLHKQYGISIFNMAPSKVLNNGQSKTGVATTTGVVTRRGLATRQHKDIISDASQKSNLYKDTRLKRKAESSPSKEKMSKRSALGNITNVSHLN